MARHATLAMTFMVDFVTARRLDDVAVHRPQGGNKRLQSPLFMRHSTGSPRYARDDDD